MLIRNVYKPHSALLFGEHLMEFCPNCGTLLRINKKEGKSLYACSKCGYEKDIDEKSRFEHAEKNISDDEVVIIENNNMAMPKVKEECKKCHNREAYWWMLQTRSGDEPATKFYRCTKCSFTWREYD